MERPSSPMTKQQERFMYRRMVQSSLQAFFGKDREEAAYIVRQWWQRLEAGKAFQDDLFMHEEALNTAGDLAGVRKVPAISEVADRYEEIYKQALPKTRDTTRTEGAVSKASRSLHAA